jgi:AraC-like DNA-binding protein
MAQTPSPLWKLQPTAQDQAWGLYVTAIGSGADLPPLPAAGWRLHMLVRGSAGLLLQGRRRQRLDAGEVLLLDALGEAELVPDPQTTCRIHFVDFAGAWMERWASLGFFAPLPRVIRTGFDEHLLGLIVRLVELARNQPPDVGRMLGGALANLLARLESATRQGAGTGRQHDLVAEARHLLSDPDWDHTGLEALAAEVGVSYSWFRRAFRAQTGQSPQRFRDLQRLDRACQLLADPSLSVGAVARAMGFSSQAYFTRVFRKETGLSPSVWRASQLSRK